MFYENICCTNCLCMLSNTRSTIFHSTLKLSSGSSTYSTCEGYIITGYLFLALGRHFSLFSHILDYLVDPFGLGVYLVSESYQGFMSNTKW